MRKVLLYLLGFGVLFVLYVTLKNFGVIGRQFQAGTNTQSRFEITSVGQTFTMPINNHKRGIYRYSGRLVFGEMDFAPQHVNQNASFTFEEKICESKRSLGTTKLRIEVQSSRSMSSGIGRYGALIKTPFLQKQQKVCLEIMVDELSAPIFEDLELDVWVGNTRTCWGIECMLD